MRQLVRRVWYVIRHRQLESDLAEEMEFHRTMKEREAGASGLDSFDASLAARRAFGSAALAQNRSRDVWIWPWLQDIAQDLRFAARLLWKDRRFTLAAIAALALGIGTSNTVFTIVNGTLIRALPFDRPEQLVSIRARDPHGREIPPSYPDFQDWRNSVRTFVGMAGEIGTAMNLSGEDRPAERVVGSYISFDAFRLLGHKPILGRDFLSADDQPGATPVVIIGNGIWKTRYGSDPHVIGRTVRVNDVPSTIVGVMPERFSFPFVTEAWQPLSLFSGVANAKRDGQPRNATPSVFGRLADRVTIAQAQADLGTIAARLARDYPATNKDVAAAIVPLKDTYVSGVKPLLLALMGAVTFVLLIACVNVANLLLARAAHRSREIGIRASLGATRWRIVRQLLIESGLLGVMAGMLGMLFSIWGVRIAFAAFFADSTQAPPFWLDWNMDSRVYGFLAVICLGTSLLFGLVPALHISRTNVNDVLKDGGRSGAGSLHARHWTSALMAAELALTLILLAGAGLMLRSFLALYRAGSLIDTSNLITMRLAVANQKYPTAEQRKRFFEQLDERLTSVPGISSVTIASDIPFMALSVDTLAMRQVAIDGRPLNPGNTPPAVARVYVGARYFETLGLGVLRGRGFQKGDELAGQEAAIVNQRFASMFFGAESPLGQRIRLTPANVAGAAAPWLTIVGISPTVPQFVGASSPEPVVYIPVRAEPAPHRFASVIVRGGPGLAAITPLLREAVRAVDPDLPLYFLSTMEQTLAMSRRAPRLWGGMFGLLAGIALALASVGLYAVTAHGITQRTQEIGVRMALGAQSRQVVWLFVRRTIVQLSAGLAIGLGGALLTGRLLQTFLVQTDARDPITLVSVAALLILVSLAACIGPARRAARVDPVVALRYE
jgi:putative ABC transport system permease protein